MKIQPIVTANQSISQSANQSSGDSFFAKADKAGEASFAGAKNATNSISKADKAEDNDKLDVNCEGCRIHSLNGNKINYFA